MGAAAALVALFAFGRLMASERLPSLDSTRLRWRSFEPRARAYVRSAPGTYVYLFVVLVTTWVLQTSSATIAKQLLLERSTNLHHLAHDPVRVLFASAFWVSSAWELLAWLGLFTLVVAPVEHWIGTARAAAAFVAGHLGATLLTAAGLWAAIHGGLVSGSLSTAADVGASYGFLSVAALLTYRLRPGRRAAYAAFLVVLVAGSLAFDPSPTAAGHLLALAIGFACYPLVRSASREPSARPAA